MSIRPAEIKDKKAILDIIGLLHLDIPNFIWSSEEFIAKQIERGEYFLVEEQSTVAGIISLRRRRNKMNIETLAVRKDFQGKGVGSKLIEFAKQFTKDNGFKILHAYSFIEYEAVDFYLKRGFKKLNTHGYYYNGHKYDCFEIRL